MESSERGARVEMAGSNGWDGRGDERHEYRARVCFAIWAAGCVALPFLLVQFPPSTDLPQHVAQIRLFTEAVSQPDSVYRIQWLTPYGLVYGLLGVAWQLVAPLDAGRVGLLLLAVLWVGAIHGLAAVRHRAPEAATLASMCFFSPILYWGFLSFAMGWPAFGLWMAVTTRDSARGVGMGRALSLGGAAALLYVAHALWFAVGMAWLVLHAVVFRLPWRITLLRLASVSPVVVAAGLWYPQLAAQGFSSPTIWASTPIGHLSFSWLAGAAFGGLRGLSKYGAFAAIACWLGLALWQHRGALRQRVDRELCVAGVFLFSLAVWLPYEHTNTIEFGNRWMPPALILLLLGIPPPDVGRGIRRVAVLSVLTVFCLATAAAWVRYEQTELTGLRAAVDALPAAPRVIGLDLMEDSPTCDLRPHMQLFAYAQVAHGGELNFSFAQFAPMPVVYRQPRKVPWTPHLEWEASRVKPADFAWFDYAIVGGAGDVHATCRAMGVLDEVTTSGYWRLYRTREVTR